MGKLVQVNADNWSVARDRKGLQVAGNPTWVFIFPVPFQVVLDIYSSTLNR